MRRTRRGFTLVELLIVIAIIGVLAAMMTLSSADATLAAKAASIANGYKVIGTAFTVYHAVSGDEASAIYFSGGTDGDDEYDGVSPDYVGPQVKNLGKYEVSAGTGATLGKFYVKYNFDATNDAALKAKFLIYSQDMGMDGSYKMRIY